LAEKFQGNNRLLCTTPLIRQSSQLAAVYVFTIAAVSTKGLGAEGMETFNIQNN